jgi:hypothetical protein
MKRLLSIILLAAALTAAPAAGQTIKSLGYNTTNGQVVYSGTNTLTFTNPLNLTNTVRVGVFGQGGASGFAGRTSGGNLALYGTNVTTAQPSFYGFDGFNNTAFSAGVARTNLGLSTTDAVTFQSLVADQLQVLIGTNLYVNLADDVSEFFVPLQLEDELAVVGAATFSTNVTVNGNLSVGSLTTTTPSTWALDATQTAAATNGILALPSNANVIRLTNNNAISGVSGGVLGAFYYLVNQTTNAVTISNVGGITVQGGTPLTLGANQAATLVATGATNASVAARGDLNDVTLGGTANTAPSQTASSGASLMTRDLSDDRYFNQPNLLRINVNNFTGAAVGGTASGQLTGLLNAQGQTLANTVTNSFLKMGTYPAQSGSRASFNFSKKMRAKVWLITVVGAGSASNSSAHYVIPTVSGYNAGQPSHKSFGFVVSGSGNTIKGFAHNGTNYNTTTNSVTWVGNNNYLGVVENNGAGVYSFWVNDSGTYTSLGTISGPTGTVNAEYLFGANANSTTTNDVNLYYIVKTLDFASEP